MVIPVQIWGHALRIWLAAVVALYVAFWLQLGGASSAAVTVAILAQPTRGAALAKAANRIAATFIGAAMSIVIAGLFPGERVGLLAAFILWMCVCVFVASYFRGFRAYAAVLSGYTVGIITVVNIDAPQKVFTTMTDRVAAITIGILCVTLINDLFGSPPVWLGLERRITQAWRDVREYARDMLEGAKDEVERAGTLLAAITGLRDEVDIVAHDMADGRHRAGGARSAMLALVEIVQQVRLVSLLEHGDPLAVTIRDQCLAALDGNRSGPLAFLATLRDDELSRPDATVAAIGQIQQALRFVESMTQLEGGLVSLREGSEPPRGVRLPHRKEFFFALQNAIRIGIALSAGAFFLVLAGWPASALALTITAIVCALSTTMPDPSKAAVAAVASFALAAVSADIVHFYLLTDSQDFIRLAIAIAPVVIFGCLFSANPKIAGIGLMMNVIFLFLLAPSNPQTFNALTFFSQCMFVAFALGVLFLASRLVWPVSELDKQWAVVRATKETWATLVTGKTYSLPVLSVALASRIADYVAAATDKRGRHPEILKGLLATNDLSLAAAAANARLQSSDDPAIRARLGPLRRALQSGNSRRLYAGARSILRRMQKSNVGRQESLLAAVTDLSSAGLVLERERRRIRRFTDTGVVSKEQGAMALGTKRRTVVNLFRYLATGVLVVSALVAVRYGWLVYVTSPWTRDGMVRVQVANVAPQVSGQIVEVRTYDNQHVHKGDILYVIEKFDFEVALENAKATILSRQADLEVKKAQNARRALLTTLSTSIEEKQVFDGNAKMAEAALASARAALAQAEINLQRTEVRSPVDGYVTNLLMRVGDSARVGTANVSVIDENSYWIDAYFEETKLAHIHVGDEVEATLLGYQTTVKGRIESITGGISAANAASSTQGLPNVDPVFTWVRLAQRIPVRIRIGQVPQDVPLIAGMTCSVSVVGGKQAPAPKPDRGILDRLMSGLG